MTLLDTTYSVCYMGHSSISSYLTESALPWIIAEIELGKRLQNVTMLLTAHGIELKKDWLWKTSHFSGNSITTPDELDDLAEDLMKFDDFDAAGDEKETFALHASHELVTTESFVRVLYKNVTHARKILRNNSLFFLLITRESKEEPVFCHAFKADLNLITIICADIEKRILLERENGMPCIFNKFAAAETQETHSDNDCVRFEVMLVGIVSLKNPEPPHTLIDQAVAEFEERYKHLQQSQNENSHGNNAIGHISVSPGYIDSGSPSNSYMDDSREGSLNMLRQMRQRCSSFHHGSNERPVVQRRQRHKSEPSTNTGDARKTRIRLFQIGYNSIKMVCPNKTVQTMEIEFSSISRCMQGIKNLEHFGLIANITGQSHCHKHDKSENKTKKVVCYVFRCADENICEEIMLGIKQAFATCFNESSPAEEFDSFCKEINAASPKNALLLAKRKMLQLSENEVQMIKAQITEINSKNQHERLAAVMAALRQLFEIKHIKHMEEVKTASDLNVSVRSDSPGSKFGDIKSKALMSFGNLIQKGKKKMHDLQLDMEHLSEKHATSPMQKPNHNPEPFSHLTPTTSQKENSVLGDSPASELSLGVDSIDYECSTKSTSTKSVERNKSEPPYLFYHKIFYSITNTGPYATSSTSQSGFSCAPLFEKPKKNYGTVEDIRAAWKSVIRQQILLNKINSIESPNPLLNCIPDYQNEYTDVMPVPQEMEDIWIELFKLSADEKEELDSKVLHAAVCKGVMNSQRGRVWKLLRLQCHSWEDFEAKPNNGAYQKLLDNLTPYQHAIIIDIGRTFPTHPMYCQLLGPGQLSLFNVLKAYSLLDKEVGYCQGLSFIAGVLLMHTCVEDEAYQLLCCIMHEIGCRSMYLPDMKGMKLAMYKMTRLLHDTDNDIFEFFEKYEVTMMLVATPWFLTMYASTFPMGFVARVFDMVFEEGTAALFKIGMCLLHEHRAKFLMLDDFEDIVNYIKNEIPQSDSESLSRVIEMAMEMPIDSKLKAYDVEYRILCEELPINSHHVESRKRLEENIQCLENVNHKVTESNCDLLNQLQNVQLKVAMLKKQLRDATRV